MPAGKATYIILWKNSSQIYSAATLETAIKTPVIKGNKPEDKRILFASYLPDEEELCVFPLTQEEIDKKLQEIQEKETSKDVEEDKSGSDDN